MATAEKEAWREASVRAQSLGSRQMLFATLEVRLQRCSILLLLDCQRDDSHKHLRQVLVLPAQVVHQRLQPPPNTFQELAQHPPFSICHSLTLMLWHSSRVRILPTTRWQKGSHVSMARSTAGRGRPGRSWWGLSTLVPEGGLAANTCVQCASKSQMSTNKLCHTAKPLYTTLTSTLSSANGRSKLGGTRQAPMERLACLPAGWGLATGP